MGFTKMLLEFLETKVRLGCSIVIGVTESLNPFFRKHISETAHQTSIKFCACYFWPWLAHPLATLQYVIIVMYCRFY